MTSSPVLRSISQLPLDAHVVVAVLGAPREVRAVERADGEGVLQLGGREAALTGERESDRIESSLDVGKRGVFCAKPLSWYVLPTVRLRAIRLREPVRVRVAELRVAVFPTVELVATDVREADRR